MRYSSRNETASTYHRGCVVLQEPEVSSSEFRGSGVRSSRLIILRLISSAWMKGHWRSVLPIGSLRSAAILSRISQMWTGWLIFFCV